jgi:flagellin-specific chaperone FliS
MLLSLYDAAISNAEQALHCVEQGDEATALAHQLRATQIVFGLEAGLAHDMGDIPQHIDRLCQYVRVSLSEGTPEKLRSALRVLTILREAFQAIQGDVSNDPQLASLAEDSSLDLTA